MPVMRAQVGELSINGVSWPLRAIAEWCGALEATHLLHPRLRRALKAAVDFSCGALSAATAIVVAEGVASFGVRATALLAVAVGCFLVTAETLGGGYRTMWRYTSLQEAAVLALSSFAILAGLLAARWLDLVALSGSTTLLTVLLMLFLCIGVRTLRRWQVTEAKRNGRQPSLVGSAGSPHRVLIAGAGEHGLSIGRELARAWPRVEVVGFVDDDRAKMGASLHGLPVLGPLSEALPIAERYHISEVLVAMPASDPEVVRSFVRQAEAVGIRVRTVRGVERFVTGQDLHRPGSATLHELLDSTGLNGRGSNGGGQDRHVLVTGGAGYIGSHLTRLLLARGYQVRVLDRFDYGHSGLAGLQHPGLEVLRGDICNSRDLSRAVHGTSGVIALAAIVGDPACNLDPEETINLNYTATKILVDACSLYDVRRLVFASSCSVYGANGNALLTEGSRLNPVSLYARTRVLSENILFDRRGDVEPVVLRLSTVFGLSPRMRFDLVVNTLTAQAVVDQRISVFGGNQWRPNVHCRDAAQAFVAALEAPAAAVAGEIFNVGGDELNHRIDEIGVMVGEIVGDVEVRRQGEVTDPRDYRVSFKKIRQVLGFTPQFSVRDGIREVAAAVRADPALRGYQNPVYSNVQALQRHFAGHRGTAAPALAGA